VDADGVDVGVTGGGPSERQCSATFAEACSARRCARVSFGFGEEEGEEEEEEEEEAGVRGCVRVPFPLRTRLPLLTPLRRRAVEGRVGLPAGTIGTWPSWGAAVIAGVRIW
jgi:hypothetical protein